MTRLLVIAMLAGIASTLAALASGCGAAHSVKERVLGPDATATVTYTPTATRTFTPTPTITPTPTPTATPTPPLPANPDARLRWNELPVHFCTSAGGDGYVTHAQFIEIVEQAFDAWGLPWRNDGECGPVTPDDGVNEIGWGALTGSSPDDLVYEAGLTQTVAQECRANCDLDDRVHLSEADITIDSTPPEEFRSRRCLYSTMLHEAGHFLGIDHLPAPAVMTAQTSGCPGELTAADRAALRIRYGVRAP